MYLSVVQVFAKVKLHKTNILFCHESLSIAFAGAGDGLVHRLPGPHLLLVPRLPGGEQVQQRVCHLRRRAVVGHGECGQSPADITDLRFSVLLVERFMLTTSIEQRATIRSERVSLRWLCHHSCIIETGY